MITILIDYHGFPIASETSLKSYRPLTTLTFKWNYLLHELRPFGYHLVNVVTHAIVSALLVSFSSFTSPTIKMLVCSHTLHINTQGSFVAALIFAGFESHSVPSLIHCLVHPIHTDAVPSVVGRAEILCALFYLLAVLFFCRSLTQSMFTLSCSQLTRTYQIMKHLH
jgi:hypothetical protein